MGSVLRSEIRRAGFLGVVRAAAAGSEDAANEVAAHCIPQVSSYLARRGADHPEALANQVVAEFLRSLPRLEFASSERAWSYLYNVARSRLADEKRVVRLDQTLEFVEVADPGNSAFDEHLVERMWVSGLLSNLTDDQRKVVELRFKDDLTLEETANRTGKSLSAVKGLQRRALAALAAAAAIAALILLVVAAAWLIQGAAVSVQSLDPVSDFNSITGQDGDDDGAGSGNAVRSSGAVPTGIQAVPLDPGGPERASGTDDRGLGSEPGGGQGITPATNPFRVGETAGAGSASPTTTVPSATTSTAPEVQTTATPTPPVVVANPDFAGFVLTTGDPMWVDVFVLANDAEDVSATTLRLLRQDPAHYAQVLGLDATPFVRFHPGAGGSSELLYEVCSPEGCQQTTITISITWYNPDLCDQLSPTIVGTEMADMLVGTAGDDIIFGLGGHDEIVGGGGNDIICGGAGDDIITGGAGDDIILGGSGYDDISGSDGIDVIFGGSDDDLLRGGQGTDQIFGGPGDDDIRGGAGSDALYGESGDDPIVGGSGPDVIFGGPGVDRLEGSGGADLIHGGQGADTMIGGPPGSDDSTLVGDEYEDAMSEGVVVLIGDVEPYDPASGDDPPSDGPSGSGL
ncbi:MAG: sigma-70 family RNA polymerase sigma factor [Actinomycetota bacterium]